MRHHTSPVLVFFVPPDKHGEGLRRLRYAQKFYYSTCRWWVSCRKSIYPSIPKTCVPLLRHFFFIEHVLFLHCEARCWFSIGYGSFYDDILSPVRCNFTKYTAKPPLQKAMIRPLRRSCPRSRGDRGHGI